MREKEREHGEGRPRGHKAPATGRDAGWLEPWHTGGLTPRQSKQKTLPFGKSQNGALCRERASKDAERPKIPEIPKFLSGIPEFPEKRIHCGIIKEFQNSSKFLKIPQNSSKFLKIPHIRSGSNIDFAYRDAEKSPQKPFFPR